MAVGAGSRGGACAPCLRRSWLLGQLSAPLDYRARDRSRLHATLDLGERELLAALGGRRGGELSEALSRFHPAMLGTAPGVAPLCRHNPCFPTALREAPSPTSLFLTGGAARLHELTARPVVALLGARDASDYGRETSAGIARGLAASGVTVATLLRAGVGSSAQEGVLEVDGAAISVLGGGIDVAGGARLAGLRGRLAELGCSVAELPCGCSGRRFGDIAAERILIRLACVLVLVEARAESRELAAIEEARALGRGIAAVPGRASSPLSAGTHAMIREGATLVGDAGDVLELLLQAEPARAPLPVPPSGVAAGLAPLQRRVLEQVAAGSDNAEALASTGAPPGAVLLALSELEVMGLLGRGGGGRYVAAATARTHLAEAPQPVDVPLSGLKNHRPDADASP